MATSFHIHSRIRAYGKARIDLARRAGSEREFQSNWREPLYPFPFEWGEGWKYGLEYKVEDFAAEVGFYIDVLGFAVNAFSPSFAQFSPPDEDFCISVAAAQEGDEHLPPTALRLQWMIADIDQAIERLVERGITLEGELQLFQPGSQLYTATFTTPGGVAIDLFGYRESIQSEGQQLDENELDHEPDHPGRTLAELTPEAGIDLEDEDEFTEERDFLARTLGEDHLERFEQLEGLEPDDLEEDGSSTTAGLATGPEFETDLDDEDYPNEEDEDEPPPARPSRRQGQLPIGGIRARAGSGLGRETPRLASLKRSVSDLELTYTQLDDDGEIED